MPQQALCGALEVVINKALSLNSSQEKLSQLWLQLEGKRLSVELAEFSAPLVIAVSDGKVLVSSLELAEQDNSDSLSQLGSDCHIKTSLQTLWQLKNEQQLTELIKQEKLDVQGDLKLAQQFASIAESINIDWQSELAKHIGDVPTFKLGQLLENISGKLNFAKQQVTSDASEWLIHEQKLVVTEYELANFNQGVKQAVNELEALEQRIATLTQKAKATKADLKTTTTE